MNNAYRAWVAASKFLFWAFVESITRAISINKKAALAASAFNPRNPRDLWAAGYIIFAPNISMNGYDGHLPPTEAELAKYVPSRIEYFVHGFGDSAWSGIPYHDVSYSDPSCRTLSGHKAVGKEYCDAHLKFGQRMAA